MEERAKAFWADFFGIEPEELDQPGVRVVPHRGLGEYAGAWIFWRGDTVFLSIPETMVDEIQAAVRTVGWQREPEQWGRLFHHRAERWIGPAIQAFLNPSRFSPLPGGEGTRLPDPAPLLSRLEAACDPEEWSHAGLDPTRPEPCFGVWVEDQLVAAAQNSFWAVDTISPGLIVHPAHRGRGYGKAVLSAAVSDALAQGHLALYQTLRSNTPAVQAAVSLGFTPFATHLAIRFRS